MVDTPASTDAAQPGAASARTDAAVPDVRGTCYMLFAYDLGLAIDLDAAQRLITADMRRTSIRHKRRAPYYFEYQPPPLRVAYTGEPIELAGFRTDALVEAVLYDFGAVSVQYTIPLNGSLAGLRELSDTLYDNEVLWEASRGVVMKLVDAVGPTIKKLDVMPLVEDYAIYQIKEVAGVADSAEVVQTQRQLLAQILRAEGTALSEQEVRDALAYEISYSPSDRTLIDWNASLLFDRDADDVRSVLEYANVELLEYRYLDDRLDQTLEHAHEAVARWGNPLTAFIGTLGADMRRIAEFQTDSALLYEGVNNALKLLGDQYLARVHRLVSQRFHLADWDSSILRKLESIESIYDKINDQHANRRIEILEWIIIILIALEIVMSFVPGLR